MRCSLAAPTGADDAIGHVFAQVAGVGTGGSVDFDAAIDGDETENRVAENGVAALRQRVVDAFQVAADDEFVVLCARKMVFGEFKVVFLGTARLRGCVEVEVVVACLDVFFDDGVHVEFFLGDLLVEVAGELEAHFLDGVRHHAL